MVRITDFMEITLTAKDLKRIGRLNGWAPGSYEGKCGDCGGTVTGDKRSRQCFVCAVVSTKAEVINSED
jgi:hypothetical protein